MDNTDNKDKISHTAYKDGNDLTIEQLGDFDSSLILSSKGTGVDAIKLNTEVECIVFDSKTETDFKQEGFSVIEIEDFKILIYLNIKK